jgi:hypothetical protein
MNPLVNYPDARAVTLVLLSGCSDGISDSDDMSDLKLYVEGVKSRKPPEDPFGEGYVPMAPPLPVFTPDDSPFDQDRALEIWRTDEGFELP